MIPTIGRTIALNLLPLAQSIICGIFHFRSAGEKLMPRGGASATGSVPWLGIVIAFAVAIVLIFLINRVVPPQDGCTSDLIAQAKGLDFSVESAAFKANTKISPAAQAALTERLQEYAQQTSVSCRMFKSNAISAEEYRIKISQIDKEIGVLRTAAVGGQFSSSNTDRADLSKIIYDALNQNPIGPFIVFFDWSKGSITPEAASIIESAAGQCKVSRAAGASLIANVEGFRPLTSESADDQDFDFTERPPVRSATATPSIVDRLGPSRLISVVQLLKQSGCDVPATVRIGEDPPSQFPTADGVRDIASRRVEIRFSPAVI